MGLGLPTVPDISLLLKIRGQDVKHGLPVTWKEMYEILRKISIESGKPHVFFMEGTTRDIFSYFPITEGASTPMTMAAGTVLICCLPCPWPPL